MSSVIGKGGNVALGGGRLHVTVAPAGIDLSVLCVRDHGKVGDDSEFVFYNQPVSPDGAVRLTDGAICIDLPNVGAVTDRLVVAASVDNGVFGGIPLAVRITEDGGLAHDLPITGLSSETTVILGEVYRRASGWKLRNVAQGYSSGLAGLATDFGISVDDEPSGANQNAAQPFSSPAQSAVPHTPAFGQPQVPPTGSPGTAFGQPPAGSPHAASFGQPPTRPTASAAFGQPPTGPTGGTSSGQPPTGPTTGAPFGQPPAGPSSGTHFGTPPGPYQTGAQSFPSPPAGPPADASFGTPPGQYRTAPQAFPPLSGQPPGPTSGPAPGPYEAAPQTFPPPHAGANPGATPDSHQRAFPPSAAPHGMHPQTPPPPGVNFSKGAVTLTKNAPPVLLEKSPVIRLRVAWASGTDYEAYALVVLNTGEVVHVATFDAKDTPANPHYRDLVRHLGDRGRGHVRSGGGQTEEIIEVRFAPEIVAIVPVAYSAINNGTGSFFKYRVSLSIENGADQVVIPADQAKKSSWIFTCVPGIVYNRPEGVLIERLELYSKRFSESRPAAFLQPDGRVEVKMDKGPINQFKADRS
ncbi:Stress response protein SCP2 [Nocardia amikacinitolerans]|uniref:TerD family protein n=1 Tax=Nocardia amikacinitolerans TaxID=756689 RepID=UPI0009FDC2F8|nr:TerD family protein [Nocardia amikacinitolerans]MCP2321193.1 Stress response protein SCP2 [Nocardia amikacinitolerans]